jgi:hypothetical protein
MLAPPDLQGFLQPLVQTAIDTNLDPPVAIPVNLT